MSRDNIKRPDSQFDAQQAKIVSKSQANAAIWKIPVDRINALIPLQTKWKTAYQKASDPDTATKVAIKEKIDARKAYEDALRVFVKADITYNPDVTDGDRESMGLPVHSNSRTPSPKPTTIPEASIDTSVIRQLTIAYRDTGSDNKAKPEGVHGVEMLWAITDTPAPPQPQLTNSTFDTHSPLTMTFTEEQRGKSLSFALRWENTRGEKGPLSFIQSTVIP